MLLMQEISVILPAMSTAILPDDAGISSGHSTGMNLRPILKRIEQRLDDLGLSADKASTLAKKPDAIRNLRRAVKEGGRKGVSTDTIRALAPVLKTSTTWLMDGKPDDIRSEDVAAGIDAPPGATVKIKGYVGAGSTAHFYAVADDAFEEVPAPSHGSEKTIALQIRGKSWGPAMDSWLVFYDDVRSPVTSDLLGEACVVGLSDDRILLKVIRSNGRGGYDLHPNSTTDDVIRDAEIEWAAKVVGMRPR